ncbi:hypothetical protein GH714_030444 [Hevea brasiliensis]|uniref:Uncharacterized protein n=1 Tax=Hevea brasiliensis TaxID=3981 RepID=A0A6A6N509_HEVBR|nr:hypothetical protein GH714_030444 [Hevea brasiliensis]
MDGSESLHIDDQEENGDEFYEKIEAPKFVDLTAPDPYNPGDDRYWFCLRVAKALTTPRTKKQLSNPDAFRSVRNPKTTATAVPKSRVAAKALVFHSPKKSVRTKSSLELNTPVNALCAEMKKLEITSAKKQLPPDAAKKQLRGREVKSRVFDGLHSQNHKNRKAKCSKYLKKNNTEENSQQYHYPVPHERDENDFSEAEIEEKIRNGSQGLCSTFKNNEGNENEGPLTNKVEASSDACGSDSNSLSNCEGRSSENDDKRHTSTSDDKENDTEVMESDDKENVSASDDNRESDLKVSHIERKILGKHETPKGNQKTTEAKSKQSKENSTTAASSAQGLKHKKPKPTNPKPFRLRTDERGILKEQEKKLYPAPLSEITTVPSVPGGSLQKKCHNAIQRIEKCIEQTENCTHTNENIEKETNRAQISQPQKETCSLKNSKDRVRRKFSSAPLRHTISSQKKLVASQQECSPDKSSLKLGSKLRRTKSPSMKEHARPREAASGRKEMISVMTTDQLGTIKENSPTILEAKKAAKPTESRGKGSVSPVSRPSLQGRRFKTIAKEPNFHAIHVPKSCTRRVA